MILSSSHASPVRLKHLASASAESITVYAQWTACSGFALKRRARRARPTAVAGVAVSQGLNPGNMLSRFLATTAAPDTSPKTEQVTLRKDGLTVGNRSG